MCRTSRGHHCGLLNSRPLYGNLASFCGSTTLIQMLHTRLLVGPESALSFSVYQRAKSLGVNVRLEVVRKEWGFEVDSKRGDGLGDSAGELVGGLVTESCESERVTRDGADAEGGDDGDGVGRKATAERIPALLGRDRGCVREWEPARELG